MEHTLQIPLINRIGVQGVHQLADPDVTQQGFTGHMSTPWECDTEMKRFVQCRPSAVFSTSGSAFDMEPTFIR